MKKTTIQREQIVDGVWRSEETAQVFEGGYRLLGFREELFVKLA